MLIFFIIFISKDCQIFIEQFGAFEKSFCWQVSDLSKRKSTNTNILTEFVYEIDQKRA